jgi:hypothetical protein
MWPLNYLYSRKACKRQRGVRRTNRVRIALDLEPLEERWLPNGAIAAAATPPPTFIQAAIALYSDGVNLGVGWVNQSFFDIPETDAYPAPPADLKANIAFNSPYIGSFAPWFVLAGEIVGADVQYQLQLASFQTF